MKSSEEFIKQREQELEDQKRNDRQNSIIRLEYILNKQNKTKQSCQSSQQTTVSREN